MIKGSIIMLARLHPRHPGRRHPRSGFTLIEILIVIVILAILAALLLPAINGVRVTARVAQVRTEISGLESAIATFKSQYGTEPPSSLTIWETPTASNGWASTSPNAIAVDSRAKIRQIWPQFDFTAVRDFNCNGVTTDVVTLSQGECLVFFLGGILKRPEDLDGDGILDSGEDTNGDGRLSVNVGSGASAQRSVCTGFSKNPLNPFASGGNRDTAIYDFDTSRLSDINNNGFPELLDPLPGQTSPYLYFSSYGGTGYRYNSSSPLFEFTTSSVAPYYYPTQPYLQGSGAGAQPWKSKSFQIISPGADHMYGAFGSYAVEGASGTLSGPRSMEADNITNFASGRLGG
jgi:prepilin-type N-terminal cleavage/methylation domain-containing protein